MNQNTLQAGQKAEFLPRLIPDCCNNFINSKVRTFLQVVKYMSASLAEETPDAATANVLRKRLAGGLYGMCG